MTLANISIPLSLQGQLIVSCQAAPGDPLDDTEALRRLAASALRGGAAGLRADGFANISAFRSITKLPILGIEKKYEAGGEVYITPSFASAQLIAQAGADVIALDCTARRLKSPEPWPGLIGRIHHEIRLPVLADIATLEEAIAAVEAGADAVATTLYGFTPETAQRRSVSWELIQGIVAHVHVPVIVEGHIVQPEEARRAMDLGAFAVVVGSSITRPETIASRFVKAIHK